MKIFLINQKSYESKIGNMYFFLTNLKEKIRKFIDNREEISTYEAN